MLYIYAEQKCTVRGFHVDHIPSKFKKNSKKKGGTDIWKPKRFDVNA